MITPKLTPSGTYVAQVRVGSQRVRLYGDTSRDVMEQYYRLTSAPTEDNPTLEDAMLRYILASETLSPNTIREYRRLYDRQAAGYEARIREREDRIRQLEERLSSIENGMKKEKN